MPVPATNKATTKGGAHDPSGQAFLFAGVLFCLSFARDCMAPILAESCDLTSGNAEAIHLRHAPVAMPAAGLILMRIALINGHQRLNCIAGLRAGGFLLLTWACAGWHLLCPVHGRTTDMPMQVPAACPCCWGDDDRPGDAASKSLKMTPPTELMQWETRPAYRRARLRELSAGVAALPTSAQHEGGRAALYRQGSRTGFPSRARLENRPGTRRDHDPQSLRDKAGEELFAPTWSAPNMWRRGIPYQRRRC